MDLEALGQPSPYTYEIEMAALAHENRRIQLMEEDQKCESTSGNKQAKVLSILAASVHMLTTMLG